MTSSDPRALSRSLLDLCRMRKLTVATAESCTGGLVAGALTEIPGSSDVVDRGFVTYSNDAKRVMLGVKASTLETFGAVSKETATAMAVGAPVSYTHLDVYKRQQPCFVFLFVRPHLSPESLRPTTRSPRSPSGSGLPIREHTPCLSKSSSRKSCAELVTKPNKTAKNIKFVPRTAGIPSG